jgi:hypothetical protein
MSRQLVAFLGAAGGRRWTPTVELMTGVILCNDLVPGEVLAVDHDPVGIAKLGPPMSRILVGVSLKVPNSFRLPRSMISVTDSQLPRRWGRTAPDSPHEYGGVGMATFVRCAGAWRCP